MADPRVAIIERWFPDVSGEALIEEAKRANLEVAAGAALVSQESGGRNIFGCDTGRRLTVPYCRQRVTKRRVQTLLRHVARGGTSNGVGVTQLTYPPYIREAEAEGGAHVPRCQMRVGFRVLADHIRQYGFRKGLGVYNGGPSNPQYDYADSVLGYYSRWKREFGEAASPVVHKPATKSKLDQAIDYIAPAVGHSPYGLWTGGIVPDFAPAYAKNGPPPPIKFVKARPIFCMGLVNLLRRHAGWEIFTYGNRNYDGGMLAAGHYLREVSEAFRPDEPYPHGTLLYWPYQSVRQQGHIGVLVWVPRLNAWRILQSNHPDGLNIKFNIESYHNWRVRRGMQGFTRAVRPATWVNF